MSDANERRTHEIPRPRSWRRICFAGAIGVVLVTSPIAMVQHLAPDPLQRPKVLTLAWWLAPLEIDGANRLPSVDADLLDVKAASDGIHVAAVGRRGTIIESYDRGVTWTPIASKAFEAPSRPVTPQPVPTPSPSVDKYPVPPAPNESPKKEKKAKKAPKAEGGAEKKAEEKSELRIEEKVKTADGTPTAERSVGAALPLLDWFIRPANAAEPPRSESQGSSSNVDEVVSQASADLVALGFDSAGQLRVLARDGRDFFRSSRDWSQGVPRSRSVDILGAQIDPPAGVDVFLYEDGLVDAGNKAAVSRSGTRAVGSLKGDVLVAVAADRVYRYERPRTQQWTQVGTSTLQDLRGLHFLDERHGWVVAKSGATLWTEDAGAHWATSDSIAPVPLNAVYFLPDGLRGWVVGNDGYVASSDDGGATFVARTRPRQLATGPARAPVRLPAPWYGLGWMFALGLLFVGRSFPASKEATTEEAVEAAFTSDRPLEPGDPDVLNLNGLAEGVSRFLRNEATRPPLSIAVTGPWGTGKSSLMNLLRADLKSLRFGPVWFNAWHHQSEEHLLASLLQAIRLQAIPPWWRPEGLLFRVHLLLVRGRKHAVGLLLLLAVTGLLLAFDDHEAHNFVDAWTQAREWVSFLVDPKAGEPVQGALTSTDVLGIGTTLALLVSLVRGLRAFGLDPGALLASAAGSIKVRDLAAQTSFREKFRVEYAEVTEALGDRRLVIFVDDLDRCRPDQVMEVLEAVNFLVTSGDCFVVLGMDRTRVEPAVALKFKDIATELNRGQDDPDARRQYAVSYLDKLVNIEVPVPQLGADEAARLLAAAAETPAQDGERSRKPPGRLHEIRHELQALLRPVVRFWPLAIAVLVPLATYSSATLWLDRHPAPRPRAGALVNADEGDKTTLMPSSEGAAASSPTSAADPVPAPKPSPVAQSIAAEIAARPEQSGAFVAPAASPRLAVSSLLALLVIAWIVYLTVQVLGLQTEIVVKDSSAFVEAMNLWHPVIFEKAATPRALRRFQNRVRFLAMRQGRADGDRRGGLRKLVDLLLGRRPPAVRPAAPTEATIPERTLVALAAIHQSEPRLLTVEDPFELTGDPSFREIVSKLRRPESESLQLLTNVSAMIATYGKAFRSRAENVRVR
jgi:hypothetical protein